MIKIYFLTLFSIFTIFSANAKELSQPFGEWLVSCKENMMTAKNDCFIGTAFNSTSGRGAIVFTKYYMAIAHNVVNLSKGGNLKVDESASLASHMNTGVSVFFKNADRKILINQMLSGKDLNVEIEGEGKVEKSLEGFDDAYKFYNKQMSN